MACIPHSLSSVPLEKTNYPPAFPFQRFSDPKSSSETFLSLSSALPMLMKHVQSLCPGTHPQPQCSTLWEHYAERESGSREGGVWERLPKSLTSNQGASLTSSPEKEQEDACQTDMPVSQSPQVDSKFRGELCSSRVQAQDPFRDVAMATILQLANK